jgi:hypothetical protein
MIEREMARPSPMPASLVVKSFKEVIEMLRLDAGAAVFESAA